MVNISSTKIFAAIGIAILIISVGLFINSKINNRNKSVDLENNSSQPNPPISSDQKKSVFVEPLSDSKDRITKKPFGIYVSPGNSPVSPEIYTGYHNGVDFEVFDNEQDTDVEVKAICNGSVLEAREAEGYGGIVIQRCPFENLPITVIYGHLKSSSIRLKINQDLKQGEGIGVLGKGFSQESGGERKHLYVGIHKDADTDIRGYVQDEKELSDWINLEDHIE